MKRILLAVMLLAVPLLGSAILAGPPDYQAQIITKGTVQTFRQGEVNRAYRIPVVKVKGTYYEMGLEYGVLLKKEMTTAGQQFDVLISSFKKKIPWYLKPLTGWLINYYLGQLEHRLPQKYQDELRGLSDGSGVPYSTLVFFTFGAGSLQPGCTLLFADLKDGMIHGRTFDFDLMLLGKYPVITEYNPSGEQSYINFGVLGYPGFFNGVNKKGISITLNYGMGAYNKNSKGLPMGLKIREMLAGSKNMAEVERILRHYPTDESGWILGVESAKENKAAVFDVFDNTIKKHEKGNDPYLYAVNRIFSPKRYGASREARTHLKMSVYANQTNVTRGMAVEKRLAGNGVHSLAEMLDLFADTEFWDYQIPNGTGSIAVNYEKTLNTILIDLNHDTVYFAAEGGFSSWGKIYQINIKDMSINLFRDQLPERQAKPVQDLLAWVDRYQLLMIQGEYQKIFECTNFNAALTPRQLYYLYNAYKKLPHPEWGMKIIRVADRLMAKYPDFGWLYQVKGEILTRTGDDVNAALNLENALCARINYDSDNIEVLLGLIQVQQRLKDVQKAQNYMDQYLALYDKLAKVSAPDLQYQKKYDEYRKAARHNRKK